MFASEKHTHLDGCDRRLFDDKLTTNGRKQAVETFIGKPRSPPLYAIVPTEIAAMAPVEHIIHQMFPQMTLWNKQGNKCRCYQGDVVLFYFSASWCGPCRDFTHKLKQFYGHLPKGSLKLIFVSMDKAMDQFQQYWKEEHGDCEKGLAKK